MSHKTPIQLRFKDMDALGHLNNANYLTFFELARIKYFRDTVGTEIDWNKDGMIIARATIDYKKPVYFNDTVCIYTSFLKMGTTSFELGYQLVREEKDGTETLVATGTSVIVCYNYKEKNPMAIPKSWIDKMAEN